jgi:phosphatidylglycerophosphatase A
MHKFLIFIATGCYSGYVKFAPGTFGTLVAIPVFLITLKLSIIGKFFIFILLLIGGLISSEYYEKYTEKNDPKEVVIDEIAAYYFILMFVNYNLTNMVITFILFRIFDIFKFYPTKEVEKIGGGPGVMFDDMIAAFYSIIIFFIIKVFLWQ